ncbi:MAG: restriction endonuclease subunit S [Steroidobacteraceae bacterium]
MEWLGEIPAGWEAKPLKHLTAFSTGWTPPTGREDLYGGDHFWANISDLGQKVITTTEKTITDRAIREARLGVVRSGSLLFSFKLSVGTVSIAGADMYTNEAIAAFSPSPRIDTQYLYWAAPVLVPRNAQENIYGAPLLNRERISNASLLSPPNSEQRAIAAFLDRETARIDGLVAKKERLIELLQEQRTALITGAVTKGLDPNDPMKDSGVEWLGEIPAHWEVKKWRYCCHITEGQVPPDDDRFRDKVMIAPNHIESGTGRILYTETADEQGAISGKYLVKPGDIIYSKIRPALNKVCVASGHWLCSADMYPVQITSSNLKAGFLLYFILSEPFVRLMSDESMRVAMPKVNREKLATCPLVIPSPKEQNVIAAFLDRETGRIDALIAKIREAIERLKELRTALISGAVTGKIDVREQVA